MPAGHEVIVCAICWLFLIRCGAYRYTLRLDSPPSASLRPEIRQRPARCASLASARLAPRDRRRSAVRRATSRGRYSTDASIYQVEPIGVVVPRTATTCARRARTSRASEGVPILPRGAGSSQCGQTVGAALVIDHSKYLNRDRSKSTREARTATVAAGHRARSRSTRAASRTACGSRSTSRPARRRRSAAWRATTPAARARSPTATWCTTCSASRRGSPTAALRRFGPAAQRSGGAGALRALVDGCARCTSASATRSRRAVPKVLRRVGGYNLDILHSERRRTRDGTSTSRTCSSAREGTLAFIAQPQAQARAAAAAQGARRRATSRRFYQAMDVDAAHREARARPRSSSSTAR